MLKLITQEEAAKLLGVSTDEVNVLRERGKLHGYRDGSVWKFKRQDVDQVLEDRQNEPSSIGDDDSLEISFGDEIDDDDAVLLSERELGEVGPSTSSTVIGKPGDYNPAESDIRLVTEDDRMASLPGGSDVRLVPVEEGTPGSDVKVVARDEQSPSGVGSDLGLPDADSAFDLAGSDIRLGDGDSEQSIDLGSDVSIAGDLVEDDSLFDDLPSKAQRGVTSDSAIDLDIAGSDISVRGGRSDVTRSAADSGIGLASPADSGLSLEQPIELSGACDEPFELGEDPLLSLGSDSDSAEVGSVEQAGDFMLTPLEEMPDSDSDDSGSQVIALDSAADFTDSPGALLGLDADAGLGEADLGGGLSGGLGLAPAGAPAPSLAPREAPYSLLQVLSLGACVMLLGLSGTMVYDLLRNMWSWNNTGPVSSPLMDLLATLF